MFKYKFFSIINNIFNLIRRVILNFIKKYKYITKDNTININRDMGKKNTSPKFAKKMIDTEKKDSILKNKTNNNLLILNNETKNEIYKSKDKNVIPMLNKQIKQVMDEYTYIKLLILELKILLLK